MLLLMNYRILPDGLAPDFTHDVALPSKILVAEGEEVVDDKSFIAIPK